MFPILDSMKSVYKNLVGIRKINGISNPILDELDTRERMIVRLAEMAAAYRMNWLKSSGVVPEYEELSSDLIQEVIDEIRCDDSIKP